MLKLSAITLLLAIFFATIVQAQQQQPPPPGVEPPPNNGTAGGGAVFDALTPPWTNCVDTPSIDIKFPPGIIDANLADVFRLEPQVRFICGGETKIFYNWTISPPPPRPIFQGPPPAAGPPQPPMGHERALVIPPGLLEGDKVYEVALVAYGRVNNTVTNPWIISNVSAFIRGRRVRPVINILGGDRRSVRRGGIIKASIESQGLQDVFDRYRVHCCKLVDNNDEMSPCSGPCLNVTLPGPGFNPSAEFASRFNRSIHAFNFTELGLYRIEANVSWMENGNDRSVTARQVVDVFPQDFPFDAVSIVAPRNDLFAGDAGFFFSASVARRNSTDRNRTSRVEWEISGNKGPAINITRPPRNDDFRLRVDPDEVASLNDFAFGQAFLEIKVKVSANAPPMGQLPAPQMNASHRVFIRPSPSAGVMCNVAKSLFDPDFANSTVTGFRSGRSRLNVTIDGLNRTEFQDVTFNVLIDIQSPDGRNYSVSISPGAEANDRAFEDFPLPYIRKNPQGKAVVFVEIGAFGRTFRKTLCGEFSLFSWNSQNAAELLAQFDRIHRRGRNAIEEKDIRSLHQTVSDFAGILSVVPTNSAQFLNNPNFGTQMGMFLNALAGMVLDQGIDNVAGRARENIISFVFEAVRVFSSRWAGNAYMTTTLPQMLIKLSSSSSEQNVPSLRNIGQDVMEIFNTVGANMPRNLRFRFLQQIIRAFGSKQSNDGPGASDNNPVNLGSSFRADVVTITGANAAANKTFNCSGGDFHVRPSPKQFENIGDEDSVSFSVGRTSASLFGMSGVLASDIFDINTLVNSATQNVQNLPEDNAFEFRIPCPAQTDCKRISCVSFDDINDRWVEIPTRLAPPLRNGTEVPQAPPSQPGQAPSQPPAGTYLPDILCKTQHLSVFSLSTTSESTSTTTPSPSASAGTVGFFTTVFMIVVSLFLF